MAQEKYREGRSMERPPLFEYEGFSFWKILFETYVRSKDYDLWYIFQNGDFDDKEKKMTDKNDQAKMMIYDALPQGELERVCMCKTTKEIWDLLLFVHHDTTQVNNWQLEEAEVEETRCLGQLSFEKIIDDLHTYEEFLDNIRVITDEEIDSLDLKDEVTRRHSSNQNISFDKDEGVEEEAIASTMRSNIYDEQEDCNNHDMSLVGVVWRNCNDEDHSRGEVSFLTTLEALEVTSNPSSSNNNLDIHRLQKENEKLIKLNEHILRDIEKHATDKISSIKRLVNLNIN